MNEAIEPKGTQGEKVDKKMEIFREVLNLFEMKIIDKEVRYVLRKDQSVTSLFLYISHRLDEIK